MASEKAVAKLATEKLMAVAVEAEAVGICVKYDVNMFGFVPPISHPYISISNPCHESVPVKLQNWGLM